MPEKLNNIKYAIIFFTPNMSDYIYLADVADIKQLCYSTCPTLPGCKEVDRAKIYDSEASAKADVYLLRYHHRDFLQIKIGIVPLINQVIDVDKKCKCSNQISNYPLTAFTIPEIPSHNIVELISEDLCK